MPRTSAEEHRLKTMTAIKHYLEKLKGKNVVLVFQQTTKTNRIDDGSVLYLARFLQKRYPAESMVSAPFAARPARTSLVETVIGFFVEPKFLIMASESLLD